MLLLSDPGLETYPRWRSHGDSKLVSDSPDVHGVDQSIGSPRSRVRDRQPDVDASDCDGMNAKRRRTAGASTSCAEHSQHANLNISLKRVAGVDWTVDNCRLTTVDFNA